MWEMDTAGEGTIRELGMFKRPPGNHTDPNPPNTGSSSTAVMYEPGKVLKVGGKAKNWTFGVPGSSMASIIDITDIDTGNVKVRDTQSISQKFPRR